MMNLFKIKLLLVLVSWLFGFNLVVTQAADLTFIPEAPLVQVGGQIALSVSGTSGEVTWSSLTGQIQGSGSQVIYLAPMAVGVDVVTVLDNSTGQVGTVKVMVSLALEVNNLTMQRAAIIIVGGGNDQDNSRWEITELVFNSLYSVLKNKGFGDEEIYYLSPKSWVDFNEDGKKDEVVDAPNPERPLEVEDVRDALAWAKTRGKLGQPLSLFFVSSRGAQEKLQLSKETFLEARDLKTILDDYQNVTGNQVVLILDAPDTGSLLKSLAAANRAVISSTGLGEAYFFYKGDEKKNGSQSFSNFLANSLKQSNLDSFYEIFKNARDNQNLMLKGRGNLIQEAQLDDDGDGVCTDKDGSWLKTVFLLKAIPNFPAGKVLPLQAQVKVVGGQIEKVWAEVKLPPDRNSNSISLPLAPVASEETIWEARWQEVVFPGENEITFFATDNQGHSASSKPVIINVIGVQIKREKDRYRVGELFEAELFENLDFGYDLYVAVTLPPDGNQFITLTQRNKFASPNQPEKWGLRMSNNSITVLDLKLPDNLVLGPYCLYGILSPANQPVLDNMSKWVVGGGCFQVE